MKQINFIRKSCVEFFNATFRNSTFTGKVFIYFFFLFYSCENYINNEQTKEHTFLLEKDSEYEVPFEFIKDLVFLRYYYTDTNEYLLGFIDGSLNKKCELFRFNLKNHLVDTIGITIPEELRDGFELKDIYLLPSYPDSMLLATSYNIFLLNYKTNKLNTINVNKAETNEKNRIDNKYYYSISSSQQPLELINNEYIAAVITDREISYKSVETFHVPVFAKIGIHSSKIDIIKDSRYPENYQKGNHYGSILSNNSPFTSVDGKCNLYYGFPKSHNMYKLNLCTGKIIEKEVKGLYAENSFKTMHENDADNMDKVMQYNIREPKYFRLLYDTNKHLLYRFYYHALDLKNDSGLYNTMREKPFSIQILDTNFTVLHEVSFNGHTFIPSHAFIDKKGYLHMTINDYVRDTKTMKHTVQKFFFHEI